jgi:hypothetical protein
MYSDDEDAPANVRIMLKMVRDPSKTAYDLLPNAETVGAFANRHAVDTYIRKIVMKREKARETRKRKRKSKSKSKPENSPKKTKS